MTKKLMKVLPAIVGLMLVAGTAGAAYKDKCVSCHGEKGEKPKDITGVAEAACLEALKKPVMAKAVEGLDDAAKKAICGELKGLKAAAPAAK